MRMKLSAYLLFLNLVFLVFVPVQMQASEDFWWDDGWSYRTEIIIPIDTNEEISKGQPIDLRIQFDEFCWGVSENDHSIRVVVQKEKNFEVIESQIYDLVFLDDYHIISCGLVFLIPEFANGAEKYFVYYDDSKKQSPDYVDHVDVSESYYYYEPISGYPFQSKFLMVEEDGFIVYSIGLQGDFMGVGTAQQVALMKPESLDAFPQNGELYASFDFTYFYGSEMEEHSSTDEQLLSYEVLVDGNLMVEFRVVSGDRRKELKTTSIYRYYFCPFDQKRIVAHVTHETLSELTVDREVNIDGVFANLQVGGFESSSIEELNFGRILPFLHIYSEDGRILEYPLDIDPEYVAEEWDIRVLNTDDDIDLGESGWACFDEGENKKAHALILSSIDVISSGSDERDGVQVKAYEQDYPHLLGLEGNLASFSFGRNSYELDEGVHDLSIPNDFLVEFDVEFFSTPVGGYKAVDLESKMFQALSDLRSFEVKETDVAEVDGGQSSLSVFVHLARSFPLGSALSALTGRDLSYISVELYQNDDILSSVTGGRLPLQQVEIPDSNRLIDKIRWMVKSLDFRNFSFFKKAVFENIESKSYLVKVFRVNPLFGDEKRFIGFTEVKVSDDTVKHVFCRPEGSVKVFVFDQNENAVKNVQVLLFSNDMIVSSGFSDDNGEVILKAPCISKEKYDLKLMYNGLIIDEEEIRLGFIRRIIPIKKTVNIELFDYCVFVKDTWDLSPEISLNPILKKNDLDDFQSVLSNEKSSGEFLFDKVHPGSYLLSFFYKSFLYEEDITVSKSEKVTIVVFPAEYNVPISVYDTHGNLMGESQVKVLRSGKSQNEDVDSLGLASFILPPGKYQAEVFNDNELIGKRSFTIYDELSVDLITNNEPIYPIIIIFLAVIFLIITGLYSFVKKSFLLFFTAIVIFLIVVSFVSPWWVLSGSTDQIQTKSSMYVFPANLITITQTSDVIAGEFASIPSEFTDIVGLLFVFSTIAIVLIFTSFFFLKNKKTSLFLLLFATITLIVFLAILSYGINEVARVGVGGFVGSDTIDVSIPGEDLSKPVQCGWGPNIGYLSYLIASILVLIMFIEKIRKMFLVRK